MAIHAPITGAPARAPQILVFPDTPIRRARRELHECRNHLMLKKWSARVKGLSGISADELLELVCQSARRHMEISLSGEC